MYMTIWFVEPLILMWLVWPISAFPQMQEDIRSGLFSKALTFLNTTPQTVCFSPPHYWFPFHGFDALCKSTTAFLQGSFHEKFPNILITSFFLINNKKNKFVMYRLWSAAGFFYRFLKNLNRKTKLTQSHCIIEDISGTLVFVCGLNVVLCAPVFEHFCCLVCLFTAPVLLTLALLICLQFIISKACLLSTKWWAFSFSLAP